MTTLPRRNSVPDMTPVREPVRGLRTAAARAGIACEGEHGAVVPPLHLSSNFTFEGPLNTAEGRQNVQAYQETLQMVAAGAQIDKTITTLNTDSRVVHGNEQITVGAMRTITVGLDRSMDCQTNHKTTIGGTVTLLARTERRRE